VYLLGCMGISTLSQWEPLRVLMQLRAVLVEVLKLDSPNGSNQKERSTWSSRLGVGEFGNSSRKTDVLETSAEH
jgi:hypothetical protein